LDAVAVYVSLTASWYIVVAHAVKLVAAVEGLTVTALVWVVVPQRPVAVALIVAAPEKAGFQSMTPVVAFMVPAPAGSTV
jgi:hypothetical protein